MAYLLSFQNSLMSFHFSLEKAFLLLAPNGASGKLEIDILIDENTLVVYPDIHTLTNRAPKQDIIATIPLPLLHLSQPTTIPSTRASLVFVNTLRRQLLNMGTTPIPYQSEFKNQRDVDRSFKRNWAK